MIKWKEARATHTVFLCAKPAVDNDNIFLLILFSLFRLAFNLCKFKFLIFTFSNLINNNLIT